MSGIMRSSKIREGFDSFNSSRAFLPPVAILIVNPSAFIRFLTVRAKSSLSSTTRMYWSFDLMNCFTTDSSREGSVGLVRRSTAPSDIARGLFSTMECMTTGMSLVSGFCFSSRKTCQPSFFGIMMSSVMSAGLTLAAAASPSSPESAPATE